MGPELSRTVQNRCHLSSQEVAKDFPPTLWSQRTERLPQAQNTQSFQNKFVLRRKEPYPFDSDMLAGQCEVACLLSMVEITLINNPGWSSWFSWVQYRFLFSMKVWKKGSRFNSLLKHSSFAHTYNSPEQPLPAWQPPAPLTGSVSEIPRCSLPHEPDLRTLSAVLLLRSPLPTKEGN